MNHENEGTHEHRVDAWIEKTLNSIPPEQQIRIFETAIQTLQNRILLTLSIVTLNAIIDRALLQTQKKFPVLNGIKTEAVGVSLNGLILDLKHQDPAQITKAIRYFLIELLTVLEHLTGGVLTKPLYKELYLITGIVHAKKIKTGVTI